MLQLLHESVIATKENKTYIIDAYNGSINIEVLAGNRFISCIIVTNVGNCVYESRGKRAYQNIGGGWSGTSYSVILWDYNHMEIQLLDLAYGRRNSLTNIQNKAYSILFYGS